MLAGLRGRPFNFALGAIAAAFGSVSLTYPFGRDQGLFHYVGREWLVRGSIPYRDVFEQKTPFIFALHGLLILLTGENMWALRLAEIGAILLIGFFASKLVTKAGEGAPDGTAGAAMLATSGFYYGYFSFEDVGNCEVWCVLFALASIVAARSIRRTQLACLVAGLLFGIGIIAKPPTIWFMPFVLHALDGRATQGSLSLPQRARNFALCGAGMASVLGASLLYFQQKHALDALIDVVLRANAHHAIHEGVTLHEMGRRTAQRVDWFSPYSYFFFAVTLGGTAFGVWRRDRDFARRYAFPLLLMIAAYSAITMQLKFFDYYYGLMLAPLSVLIATIYDDVFRWAPIRKSVVPVMFGSALLGVSAGMVPTDVWVEHAWVAVEILRGTQPWAKRAERFPKGTLDLANSMRTGEWLRANSSLDDSILVRGYEPQIYAFAERRFVGRFFWSTFLSQPSRVYRRAEWLAEDEADLARFPPRYVVAYANPSAGIESTGWFEQRGYGVREVFGPFVIMQRAPR